MTADPTRTPAQERYDSAKDDWRQSGAGTPDETHALYDLIAAASSWTAAMRAVVDDNAADTYRELRETRDRLAGQIAELRAVVREQASDLTNLRTVVASLDGEIGRLTEIVNRQDATNRVFVRAINEFGGRSDGTAEPPAPKTKRAPRWDHCDDPNCDWCDSAPAPATVAVPASLVAALEEWRNQIIADDGNLMDAYDAWKAGQAK